MSDTAEKTTESKQLVSLTSAALKQRSEERRVGKECA